MRATILRKAREAFGELGYAATTLELIAERTGVTRPVVNYHFGDKRALYREVVRSTTASVMSVAAERASAAPDLVAQLSTFIEAFTALHTDDRSAAGFLFTSMIESQRHPDLHQRTNDPLVTTRDFLTSAVKNAVDRDELAEGIDLSAVVEMLLALVWGIGFYAGFVDSGQRLSIITEQFRRLLPGELWAQPR